tara:strand:- start:2718 stop:3218 length:501 start_codon:yes stop_codon:yes gene_type:complete
MSNLAENTNTYVDIVTQRREKIINLQEKMVRMLAEDVLPEGKTDFSDQLIHHFAPNLYAREMHIPQGQVIVGKIHKHAHVNNISVGKIAVSTEFGEVEVYEAPHQWVSQPGTKRAVLAVEDTIWTTYHPTKETDLSLIEEQVIAKDFEELDAMKLPDGTLQIGGTL